MKTKTINLTNNTEKYKVINDTSYNIDTDNNIIRLLEEARTGRKRVKITYKKGYEDFTGYTKDGLNVSMYIGRSNGTNKIPLHIMSIRSHGGSALSTNLIEKVIIKN